MSDLDLARRLFGTEQTNMQALTAGRTRTYTATALSDSVDGKVRIDLGGDTVAADGSTGLEVACFPQVKQGDHVAVTIVNGTPYVSGVIGWGDSLAEAAQDAASEAAKTATNYMNFDDDGLVIGNLTNETLGRNVLIDLDSVDIRNGEDVLASFGETTIIGEEDTSNIELGKYLGVGFAYNVGMRTISGQYSDVAYLKLSNGDGSSTVEFTEQDAESLDNDVAVFNGIECKNGDLHARFGTSIYGDETERTDLETSCPLFIAVGGRVGCKATPIHGQYILISSDAVVFSHPALWLAAIGAAASSHNHAASDVNSGTLDDARIPNLAASKITSGTFDAARVPNLAASKINSGTFGIARGGTGKASVTSGSYLVGNGTSALTEKTPSEVLSDIGALPLTGGDINGALKVVGNNIKTKSASITDNVTPSANHSGAGLYMVDNADAENTLGFVRSRAQTNGRQGVQFAAMRNGAENTLGLYLDASGNRIVAVTDQAAWRAGIGANSAANLTEGTLDLARLPANVQSTDTSQITINSTNFVLNNIYTNIALGKVITINLVLKPAQALTARTGYQVGTLAAGLRPYVTMHATTNNYGDVAQVTGAGIVTYYPNEARSTSTSVRISFTYVLA